ncbi:hypothetical protein CY35_10G071700 [Sphagnum magellanicum]|nr:hypothetical protein CY35_10G071700 [Sphagnum magellanicum]
MQGLVMDLLEMDLESPLLKDSDDTTTIFDLTDDGNATQQQHSRKRRRSSSRRVSFAELPSIHVFARDDDYETPPEGTDTHFSKQSSTPSRSPLSSPRRSPRLAASRGEIVEVAAMDKENLPFGCGGHVKADERQKEGVRRPLSNRDASGNSYPKPPVSADDPDVSGYLRHLVFEDKMLVEEDEHTLDSSTFHARFSSFHYERGVEPSLQQEEEGSGTPLVDELPDKRDPWFSLSTLNMSLTMNLRRHPRYLPDQQGGDMTPSDMSIISPLSNLGLEGTALTPGLPMNQTFAEAGGEQNEKKKTFVGKEISSSHPQQESTSHVNTYSSAFEGRRISSVESGDTATIESAGDLQGKDDTVLINDSSHLVNGPPEPENMEMSSTQDFQEEFTEAIAIQTTLSAAERVNTLNPAQESMVPRPSTNVEGTTEVIDSTVLQLTNTTPNASKDTFSFKDEASQHVYHNPLYSVGHGSGAAIVEVQKHGRQPQVEEGLQQKDVTEKLVQPAWEEDASSDMSTSSTSDRLLLLSHRATRAYDASSECSAMLPQTELALPSSLQDGVTETILQLKDILAADGVTPLSAGICNPRRISWDASDPTNCTPNQVAAPYNQRRIEDMEHLKNYTLPETVRTQGNEWLSSVRDERGFQDMTEEAEHTLQQMSNKKDPQSSAAHKIIRHCLSHLKNQDAVRLDFSGESKDSQEILKRKCSLFNSLSESSGTPDSTREEVCQYNGTMAEQSSFRNENQQFFHTRREKLTQDKQELQEIIATLKELLAALQGRAKELHDLFLERCEKTDQDMMVKKQVVVDLNTQLMCLQQESFYFKNSLELQTEETGGDEFIHEFKYYSLVSHRLQERKMNTQEYALIESTIALNVPIIDYTFPHINASLVFQLLLSPHESKAQSVQAIVQETNYVVMHLVDLMEEIQECCLTAHVAACFCIPGGVLQLRLGFTDSELLFKFTAVLDLESVVRKQYPYGDLPCAVEMEIAGRKGSKQITTAAIQSTIASVKPGFCRLIRICKSVRSLIDKIRCEAM